MLKRSAALFFTLLYTASVFGFALNLHYCGKLLTSVTINAPAKNCGMLAEGKMKCCNDKHIELKVKDAHQSTNTAFASKIFVIQIPGNSFGYNLASPQYHYLTGLSNKAPPNIPADPVSVFLKNQSFRI